MADLGLEKIKRDWCPTEVAAECLAHALKWRTAATRKARPTKIALMPPAVAAKLSPERLFRSARCRFKMIRIPKTEKPRDKLTKLIAVQIFCRGCRLSNRSGVSAFDPNP